MQLNVYYLPKFVAAAELTGSTVIMVDLLRASTTICKALDSGAKCVIPCVEIDATFAKADELQAAGTDRKEIVLGGEREGKPIEGFDLGNSPFDYSSKHVRGRTVLFTTTNGTKALAHAQLAERILIGSASNRHAIVNAVINTEKVDILCAGTDGEVTREDVLTAGAIAYHLSNRKDCEITMNEWGNVALHEWKKLLVNAKSNSRSPTEQFALDLRNTLGGKNLLKLSYDDDLILCANLDIFEFAPELNAQTGEICLP